ncbi:MAG TPA: PA domain-containing protein [Polyangia bacterium]|jgi:MYXO-CTERM domain-containing protein|nr:PA domain-containing protein [Polyangia bacterium]
MSTTRTTAAWLAAIVAGAAARDSAAATFIVNNLDPPGLGFNDATPATAVGDNPGVTVGEQRQIAFQFAADVWGKVLDSPVPIVVDAHFAPLECTGGLIILGHARAQTIVASVPPRDIIPGLPPNILFPQPLADRLAGVDLDPGIADLVATFNGGLRDCDPNTDWYYGLDSQAGSLTDLVEVVVHELAHGLGFATNVDYATGAFNLGIPDAFSIHVFDNSLGLSWLEMTDAQRLASMRNVRHLVWDGANVRRLAPLKLERGSPVMAVQPALLELDGNLSETNFGPTLLQRSVTGPLVIGSPIAGCGSLAARAGGIFLLAGGRVCSPLNQADFASRAGAAALLLADPNGFAPPSSLELPPDQIRLLSVGIPVVTLSRADGQRLIDGISSAPTLTLGIDATLLTGADAEGRPYLYATDPVRPGSTVSHWDPLARPDLIEEPEAGYQHPHDVTLEAALLQDIGWATLCGNGRLDTGEECDQGVANSDSSPGACRTTCTRARCGDGVRDALEECDQGAQNGTSLSTCTKACTLEPTTDPDPGGGAPARGCACAAGPGSHARMPLLIMALAALTIRRRQRRRAWPPDHARLMRTCASPCACAAHLHD